MSNFEVQAGNARLFKLDAEKKQRELTRLKGLRETGQAWATDDQCHDYDGFIKIDQQVIDYLSFSLEHGQDRINWKGKIAKKLDGSPMLKIGDLWVGGEVPSFKKFKDSVPPSAPAKPPAEAVKPPTEAVVTEDFDDDIPF
ncbi:MAG: hypothetical protein CMC89_02765 [Flavobacteriaceae bacterium]|nr:hypothetical protein [Flavobacteriaceae bacterium]|tara:strand:+ start:13267 stop:13689 length:423 start_codon:yes stop_codon:yes gene_type:complete